MRIPVKVMGALSAVICLTGAHAQSSIPAGQLVREVVYNELHDHQVHGYWRFWIEKRSRAGTRVEDEVETSDGPVNRLLLHNGVSLDGEAQAQEDARLERFLNSPEEQARAMKQHDEDEERIGRILALLPDAFVYEYDGEEDGCYRLKFHPRPDDRAQSIEARIFHSMSGTLWVDERAKRLARLDGRVEENVDFGLGILGRLYKGGWFRLQRVQVSATEWKTERLEVHMNIRALLVKTFAKDTSEERGGFIAVPKGLSLAQGLALLNRPGVNSEALKGNRAAEPTVSSMALNMHR